MSGANEERRGGPGQIADGETTRELERSVLWHLIDNGSSTAYFDESLAANLALPKSSICAIMSQLEEAGCVTRQQTGNPPQLAWFLTDKGIDAFYAR